MPEKKVTIKLTWHEVSKIISCLFREVLEHQELFEKYKEKYQGIALSEKADAVYLMMIRKKLKEAELLNRIRERTI